MVNIGAIGSGLSAVPQGLNTYEQQMLQQAIRRQQIEAARRRFADEDATRQAGGVAFSGFADPTETQGGLPGFTPMPGMQPVPQGPGVASVANPNSMRSASVTGGAPPQEGEPDASAPPMQAPQPQSPMTGTIQGGPGGPPRIPVGTQVPGPGGPMGGGASQMPGQYDLRGLATRLRAANPKMDDTTLYKALVIQSGMLNTQQQAQLRFMAQNSTPAAVKEWMYFSMLPVPQQQAYLRMKRADQLVQLGDRVEVRPPGGATPEVLPVGVPPAQGPENAESVAEAKARGTAQGGASAKLSDIEAEADYTTKLIDDLIADPALSKVVGLPESVSGVTARVFNKPLPGTPEAGFMARVEQLRGRQFLEAFNTLKGGGQITEIEGKKATDAISRLNNLNQPESEYRKAAKELQDVISVARTRARSKASGVPGASASPASGGAWALPTGAPSAQGVKDGEPLYQGTKLVARARGGKWVKP